MFEVNEIKAYLGAFRYDFVKDVRIRSYDSAVLLYVPRERIAPVVKKGLTSLRQLTNLKQRLSSQFSTSVEIVFIQSDSHVKLESAFFQLLNISFNDQVKSFYISFVKDEKTVDSWIEVIRLSDELKSQILDKYLELLNCEDLSLGNVYWFGTENELPTIPVLLRFIKTMQPVEIDVLTDRLKTDYRCVDKEWLGRVLDNLRRKGVVHWQKPGAYTLTAASLAIIPAGMRRSSSDIDRALALGRRKW